MSSQPMLFGDEATAAPAEPKPEAKKKSFWDEHVQPSIDQAEQNANEEWKTVALECVREIAERMLEFTTDDVVELLETKDVRTHNLAALGPVIQRAKKLCWIKKTDGRSQSRIPRRHRDLTVWKSKLLEGRAG